MIVSGISVFLNSNSVELTISLSLNKSSHFVIKLLSRQKEEKLIGWSVWGISCLKLLLHVVYFLYGYNIQPTIFILRVVGGHPDIFCSNFNLNVKNIENVSQLHCPPEFVLEKISHNFGLKKEKKTLQVTGEIHIWIAFLLFFFPVFSDPTLSNLWLSNPPAGQRLDITYKAWCCVFPRHIKRTLERDLCFWETLVSVVSGAVTSQDLDMKIFKIMTWAERFETASLL